MSSGIAERSKPVSSPQEKALALNGGSPVSSLPVPMVAAGLHDADIDAAIAVLRSGMLRQGARSNDFEKRFASMTDASHALTCANGTCALQLAYEALLQPGDLVLVPAWSYIATVSMVVARGAKPVFVDADPATYQLDLADAARKMRPGVKAIAPTHLYGNAVDISATQALAAKHSLKVIYDAAQAHFATYAGKGIGAYGDAVTYSFYATKNISTGEGGMVTTNSPEHARQMGLYRSHGETQKYIHEVVGYNYRMTDVEAAIGLSQLDRAGSITSKRRENAKALDRLISKIPGLHPPAATPKAEPVFHQYAVRMDLDAFRVTRDQLIAAVQAEGVQVAVHYPRSLTQQPAFAKFVEAGACPVSERLSQSLFCIPVHQNLTPDQIAKIGEALTKVADAYRA